MTVLIVCVVFACVFGLTAALVALLSENYNQALGSVALALVGILCALLAVVAK